MTEPDYEAIIEMLSVPFPEDAVQWRAGATTRDKKKAQALPYVDVREYHARLNEVCPSLWSSRLIPWGEGRIICELTIGALTRASSGEFDDGDKVSQGPTAEAQAFKRACVAWGLGAYLYAIPVQWVPYDEGKRRLEDTPRLPAKFLPARQATTPAPRQERATPKATPAPARVTLDEKRASAMHKEMAKVGVAQGDHYRFASAVLGRKVESFTDLDDAEALEVWNVAKRFPDFGWPKTGRIREDEALGFDDLESASEAAA